jgi:hypothetical protein
MPQNAWFAPSVLLNHVPTGSVPLTASDETERVEPGCGGTTRALSVSVVAFRVTWGECPTVHRSETNGGLKSGRFESRVTTGGVTSQFGRTGQVSRNYTYLNT